MHIDQNKCVGCANCVPVCPMGAVRIGAGGRAEVNTDECVECFTCYRGMSKEKLPGWLIRPLRRGLKLVRLRFEPDPDVCPTSAFTPDELAWPRVLRREFSDPLQPHSSTGGGGRGTAEVKTNEITNRVKDGQAGFVVELGRPGIGVRFRDVDVVTQAVVPLGAQFEPNNPVTALMSDVPNGKMKPEILNEKIMSCIVEFRVPLARAPEVLKTVQACARRIDTVIAIGAAARCDAQGNDQLKAVLEQQGYRFYRGKVNLGLGRKTNVTAPEPVGAKSGGRA